MRSWRPRLRKFVRMLAGIQFKQYLTLQLKVMAISDICLTFITRILLQLLQKKAHIIIRISSFLFLREIKLLIRDTDLLKIILRPLCLSISDILGQSLNKKRKSSCQHSTLHTLKEINQGAKLRSTPVGLVRLS